VSLQRPDYHDPISLGNPLNGNNGKNYFPANGNGNGHPAPAPAGDTPTVSTPADTQDLDSSQLGFCPISNYFCLYWTRILGAKPALLYERIAMHAYGKKETCYPSVELLAAIMGCARGTLTGRERVNKETGVKGHKEGFLEILKRYGLITMHRRGKSYAYQPVKTLPLLSEEQLKTLPPILRKRHEKDVEKLKEKQERQLEKDKKKQQEDMTRFSQDTTRFSPDMTRIGVTNHTESEIKKTHSEREVAKINRERAGERGTDFVAAIHSFYLQQGDEISSDRVAIETRKITPLRSEFSDGQIIEAIDWVGNNLPGGKKVFSIGAYLPCVIDKAIEEQRNKKNREIRNRESNEFLRKMERLEKEKLERLEKFVGPKIPMSIFTERARAKKAAEQKEQAEKLTAFYAEHRQKKQQNMETKQEQATMA